MSHPKVQHQVPQFLLRNFTIPGKKQICVYDKSNDHVFKANVSKVAAESKYYDFRIEGIDLTIEPSLARIEDAVSKEVEQILKSDSIAHLDDQRRTIIAAFLAIQMIRGRRLRNSVDAMIEGAREKLQSQGHDPDEVPQLQRFDENEHKAFTANMIQSSVQFIPHLLDKIWILLRTDDCKSLYISDNPLTLHNEEYDPLRGNLGLAVKGIEINFPLHCHYSLALYCQSHFQIIEHLRGAVPEGHAIPLPEVSVQHLNSLQVIFSSRFVYSCSDDFGLVREILRDDPNLRHGLRPEVV